MILRIENNIVHILQTTEEKVLGTKSPIKQLQDYLKVRVDGYNHSTAYKKRRWDGYKSFVSYGKFKIGFLEYALRFFDENGFTYTLQDQRKNLINPVAPENFRVKFGDKTLRDYQEESAKAIVYGKLQNLLYQRGILDIATNGGKNLIAAGIHANLLDSKTLFMIHNTLIFKQAIEYFGEFFNVGQVGDGVVNPQDFTVCMVKTLLNRVKQDVELLSVMQTYNVLIVDECHRAASNEYLELFGMLNCSVVAFISGTALGSPNKVKKMNVVGSSGAVLKTVTNADLIDKGLSKKPIVTLLKVEPITGLTLLDYTTVMEQAIYSSIERLYVIADVIRTRLDKSILITFTTIAHGEFMYKNLCLEFPELNIGLAHGTTKNRDEVVAKFKSGEIDILIGSMILKEGANIPIINVIIMAQGGKSEITVKQVTGRGLRTNDVDDELELFDLMDMSKYAFEHSKKRALIYKREGFELNTNYNAFRGYIPK